MIKLCVLALCLSFAWAGPLKINSKTARIVGGAVARAGQFPFIAGIFIQKPDGNYFCSGSIINNDWVLTAGQCVDRATLFTIHMGKNSLGDNSNETMELATETYVLHPEYNPATFENDLGAIKFRSYIRFSDYIKSISYLAESPLPDASIVVTMGWGQRTDNTVGPVEQLIYVYLSTISNAECRLTYGNQITDNMVCVAGNFNEGTCLGDGGSPLVQHSAAEQTYQVGISSFYSGLGCERPDPSGFTRIAPYREWLRNVTGA